MKPVLFLGLIFAVISTYSSDPRLFQSATGSSIDLDTVAPNSCPQNSDHSMQRLHLGLSDVSFSQINSDSSDNEGVR
jgi:hypothetical protein